MLVRACPWAGLGAHGRLRRTTSRHPFLPDEGADPNRTFSAGIAGRPQDATDLSRSDAPGRPAPAPGQVEGRNRVVARDA